MEQLLKKKKKFNINLIIYPLIIFFGFLLAFMFKSVNMLHATAFSGSNVTYNENQQLHYTNTSYGITTNEYITIRYGSVNDKYIITLNWSTTLGYLDTKVYTNCNYSNSVLTCANNYSVVNNSNSNISVNNTTTTWTINSNNVVNSNKTYTIVSSGYTEEQYLAYGSSQYTAGQNAVINDPHTYSLYTTSEYNANYTAGQNSVLNSPNTYNLYTSTQYNNYGTSQYNAGYTAGQNAITNNPNNYNLYTQSQYNDYGISQYNSGYTSGLNDNDGYQLGYEDGVQYVLNHPDDYNLYTSVQYETYGLTEYNRGYQEGLIDSSGTNFIDSKIVKVLVNGNESYNGTIIANSDTIDLSDILTRNNNVYEITIIFNQTLNGGIPLYLNYNGTQELTTLHNYKLRASCHLYDSNYHSTGYCSLSNDIPNTNQNISNSVWTTFDDVYNVQDWWSYLATNTDIIKDVNSVYYNSITLQGTTNTDYLNNIVSEIKFDLSNINFNSYNYGYKVGYQSANTNIDLVSYNKGYDEGFTDANSTTRANTLSGMVGTIMTEPVNMFQTMFNVEFLGINIAGFILSILSLLVVIWLIKKLL